MLKKTILVGGALLLLLALFFGKDACSYVTTMVGQVRDKMEDNFSVDFHLKRARDQIAKLTPEISKNRTAVAQEEVSVEKLAAQVADMESALATKEKNVRRLKADLDSGQEYYIYSGERYTATEVEKDLEARFAEFKTDKDTLAALQKVLNARRHGLDAARKKLVAMQNAQRQLKVRVENLEARVKMVQVAQTSSDFKFDDSRLARTKELIDQLEGKIRASEKLVNVDSKLRGRIPLEDETPKKGNVSSEIAEFFGEEDEFVSATK